jgi:hypothetical protein
MGENKASLLFIWNALHAWEKRRNGFSPSELLSKHGREEESSERHSSLLEAFIWSIVQEEQRKWFGAKRNHHQQTWPITLGWESKTHWRLFSESKLCLQIEKV